MTTSSEGQCAKAHLDAIIELNVAGAANSVMLNERALCKHKRLPLPYDMPLLNFQIQLLHKSKQLTQLRLDKDKLAIKSAIPGHYRAF